MELYDDPSPWRSVRAGPDRSIDIPCKYPDKGPMLYEVRKGVPAKARGGREGTLALERPRWQPAPARRILPQFNRMLTCAPVLASRRFWSSAPTSRERQELPSLLVRCNACPLSRLLLPLTSRSPTQAETQRLSAPSLTSVRGDSYLFPRAWDAAANVLNSSDTAAAQGEEGRKSKARAPMMGQMPGRSCLTRLAIQEEAEAEWVRLIEERLHRRRRVVRPG